MSGLDSLFGGVGSALVERVVIESNATAPITLERPLASDATSSTPPGRFDPLGMLRPRVTVQLAGGDAFTLAPAGDPTDAGRLAFALAAIALLGLAAYGAVCLARKALA